ncbi:hypothetical protein [Saccharopolyspora mangrovi]|uniref:DUF4190 domain-containing protein n=1 Tax=Saccharopolyspora mangrovi TaxID=3082379 RepID=A0ABU6AC87_9PSEU|nr:hypothetical protein [Saccharopolyspora sp. S2-29]MEB3369131.1 hypothetical protein [Saccharopolyspora sp. S2-29]
MILVLAGTLWGLGASAGAALIGYPVRRIGQDEGRSSNNDAAGQVFTIISGLQAVVLAFVLVTLFDAVGETRQGAYTEAQDTWSRCPGRWSRCPQRPPRRSGRTAGPTSTP